MIRRSDNKMKENINKWLHIAIGCFVTTGGLIILKHSHIVTGGTAGLSLSLSPLLQVSFHYLFVLLNLPFLIFSYFYMGKSFTFNSIVAIALLSSLSAVNDILPAFTIPSLIGSIVGGVFIGAGITALFRNGASLGGATILAIYLQKRYNVNPGMTNFVFDLLVVISSLSVFSLQSGLLSALSIAVTSAYLSFYKRRKTGSKQDKKEVPSDAVTSLSTRLDL
ncbi:YitT family protein [Bacillus sp. FJAT-28004]|uniref:YitT family protein n=1 Tax=Bacillus sp. FJAT-28004 TaxID=1679165 RepID=UPI0006B4CF25|nr:YitT family protein [Bacillus sp. FJAT-28004]